MRMLGNSRGSSKNCSRTTRRGEASPYSYLSEDERALRRRLRAWSKSRRCSDQKQKLEIDRLVEEIAYEHWHRMLFARF